MKLFKPFSVLLLSICLVACQSANLQPERISAPSELAPLTTLGDSLVEEAKFAGISLGVIKDGQVVHYSDHGVYGINNPEPIAPDTLFRIFSMTKPITAVAAMMLYEEGLFELDDPVAKYLPILANPTVMGEDGVARPAQNTMTIRQLLTHSAGYTYGFAPDSLVDIEYQKARLFESENIDEFMQKLAALPLRFEPGTRYRYSVSIDVVGALVEELSGLTLEEFFEQRIFAPLDMQDTFFEVPADKLHRLASDQYWNAETEQIEAMPAEFSRNYADVGLHMGGGGLVSTMDDYLKFCQFILDQGMANGERLLKPETVALMLQDHLEPEVRSAGGPYPQVNIYDGTSMGFGFAVVYDESQLPEEFSQNEVSWAGLAGTQFFIDPSQNAAGVAMVQLARQPWVLDVLLRVAAQKGLDQLEN